MIKVVRVPTSTLVKGSVAYSARQRKLFQVVGDFVTDEGITFIPLVEVEDSWGTGKLIVRVLNGTFHLAEVTSDHAWVVLHTV